MNKLNLEGDWLPCMAAPDSGCTYFSKSTPVCWQWDPGVSEYTDQWLQALIIKSFPTFPFDKSWSNDAVSDEFQSVTVCLYFPPYTLSGSIQVENRKQKAKDVRDCSDGGEVENLKTE